MFALALVFGLYSLQKEGQLRKLSRFLLDEQFHKDVVNRRLKVVETLLESSKVANYAADEKQAMDIIVRQAGQFFEHGSVAAYFRSRNTGVKLASGVNADDMEEVAASVVSRNQSQFVRSSQADSDAEKNLRCAVPALREARTRQFRDADGLVTVRRTSRLGSSERTRAGA